jgi:hypothetical protein
MTDPRSAERIQPLALAEMRSGYSVGGARRSGIGKSALLDHPAARALGCRIVRAAGAAATKYEQAIASGTVLRGVPQSGGNRVRDRPLGLTYERTSLRRNQITAAVPKMAR